MQKAAPNFGRIAVMVGFALSCFALVLFLWLAFGGPIPLKPKGYRLSASFAEASQLATEADVRISGVPVGKVKLIEPDAKTGRSLVTMELDAKYSPLPSDSKALLRQKTLLGETYVELTPGTEQAEKVPEGGRLPAGSVSATVELDEILRTFDPETRAAFQEWMQTQAQAIGSHGRDLNDALGNLGPLAEDASELVDILNRQEPAVRRLISDTGVVFEALTERDGQLRDLIENSGLVFRTTAQRDRELQEAFVALPTFEREARQTVDRLTQFARDTDPLVDQLRPAARELSPTLTDLSALAPDLKAFFRETNPLIDASKAGFPAAERVLADLRPLLAQVDPALRQLNPILDYLGLYKRELTGSSPTRWPRPRRRRSRPRGRCTTCARPTRSTRRTWPSTPAPADEPAGTRTFCPVLRPDPQWAARLRDPSLRSRRLPDDRQHAAADRARRPVAGALAAGPRPRPGARRRERGRRPLQPAGQAVQRHPRVRLPERAVDRSGRPGVQAAAEVRHLGRADAVPASEARLR